MKKCHWLLAFLVWGTVILLVGPATVAQLAGAAPIQVEGCSTQSGTRGAIDGTAPGTSPQISIAYKNVSNGVAKNVDFGLVVDDSVVAHVRDAGKFSPNVSIKHMFVLSPDVRVATGEARCVPLQVIYEDGSVWKPEARSTIRDSATPIVTPIHEILGVWGLLGAAF